MLSFCCCCGKSSSTKERNINVEESGGPPAGPTFGTVHDTTTIYNISRCGAEDEVHTKHIDVPSPFKSTVRIDDELEPSRYISIQFSEIHDSHYIGINEIEFRDVDGNAIPYNNIMVDGNEVDNDTTKAAFPPNGWWAVSGDDHSLVFDFDKIAHVKEIYFWCANSASTPKCMAISDALSPPSIDDMSSDYDAKCFFQMAGEPGMDPTSVVFEGNQSCEQVIESINKSRPENKFDSFVSEDRLSHFVFYEKGKRTSAYRYYFGKEPDEAIRLANETQIQDGVEISKVEHRAMTLSELRAVRAIIVSKCINEGWISSFDKRKLRPEDVNLYDLNETLILPLTKKRNCAFKELFSSGDSIPVVYVSHWWGESVLDFIRCCEYHAVRYGLSPDEASYWVCAYANRQHSLGTDLGADPAQSSFNKAMLLANGVLLVCDIDVVASSRIWVDFELYRTVAMDAGLDVIIHFNGSPHLIAANLLPNESPYQKNKREQHFPFEHLCKKLLECELHKGNSSVLIDKIRILNTMIEHRPLDSDDVLKRAEKQDIDDPKYQQDLKFYALSDNAIRAELAIKAISIALSTDGQDCNSFYGFDLLQLIEMDTTRKNILLNDIVSLDSVTDDVLVTLTKLADRKSIERFEINVKGCRNLTNEALEKIKFSSNLKHLSFNLGYARNITNYALIFFASKISSPSLRTLDLDFSGFKTPDGNYMPERKSNLLEALSNFIPPQLSTFKLVSTLDDENGGLEGLLQLICSLPSSIKTLCLTFEQWDNFKSGMITDIGKKLPHTLETFSMHIYNGDHIEDHELTPFAYEIKKLNHLKEFTLFARSHGRDGYYKVQDINSVSDILSKAVETFDED